MIWIIGEYAERIDNADELLESFLEGFQDENSQVSHVTGLWTVSGPLCDIRLRRTADITNQCHVISL